MHVNHHTIVAIYSGGSLVYREDLESSERYALEQWVGLALLE